MWDSWELVDASWERRKDIQTTSGETSLSQLPCMPLSHLCSLAQGEAGVIGQAGPPGLPGEKVRVPTTKSCRKPSQLKATPLLREPVWAIPRAVDMSTGLQLFWLG